MVRTGATTRDGAGHTRRRTQRDPALLSIDDVRGTRHIGVRYNKGRIKVREENSAAALEIMSRFAVDPRWLVYLPPTMAPPATSKLDGYLEHPAQAFAEFAANGITEIVCEEKHMVPGRSPCWPATPQPRRSGSVSPMEVRGSSAPAPADRSSTTRPR